MRQFEGRLLGRRYVLERYIAEGNFGAVFQGRQYFLDDPVRRVAVKLSKKTGLDRGSVKELFADAFRLAEAMDEITDAEARRHLVQIIDLGIADELEGRGYCVMDFVHGTTLAAEFGRFRGPAPANLVRKWMVQACTALAGLHRLVPPLLHCDLKPDNILLGLDLTVRLVDFGLSKRLMHAGFAAGGEGVVKYMSPETSRLQESTPASDVYSLGVVFYEGLTGRLPFAHLVPPRDLPDALYNDWFYEQRSRFPAPRPSMLNSSVTPDLDEIVLKCLEFQPAGRFRDADELLKALTVVEPPRPDACQAAAKQAQELRSHGQWHEAEAVLDEALRSLQAHPERCESPRRCEFALRGELALVLDGQDRHADAAGQLVKAWEAAEDTAIFATACDRGDFRRRIAEAWERAGNELQANRWSGSKLPVSDHPSGLGLATSKGSAGGTAVLSGSNPSFHAAIRRAEELAAQGKHREAAEQLGEAWETAKEDSTIFRSTLDQANFLERIARACEQAGDLGGAMRWRRKRESLSK